MAENAAIGVLFDWDLGEAGQALAHAVRLGIADSSFKGEVRIAVAQPNGLSAGTEHEFRKGFMDLVNAGVIGIVGPGITDNGFIARDLACEHRVPTIIWAAHEELRSEWSFHFQLGSLEEEPPVLLRHLAAQGITRVAVVYDDAAIIHRYVESMMVAQRFIPVEVVSRVMIDRDIADASEAIARLRHPEAQALLYFGLGRSAEPIGLAKRAAGWDVPVAACSSLNMGRSKPEMAASWDGWVSVTMETEANPMAVRARADPRARPRQFADRLQLLRHGPPDRRRARPGGLHDPGEPQGRAAMRQAPAGDGRPSRHDDDRGPLGPGTAQGALSRAAPLAGREERGAGGVRRASRLQVP